MKYAVEKLTMLRREPGQFWHFHGDDKKPCLCRAGIDAAFAQGLASVPPAKQEAK